jgi:hypothetical protein
MPCFSSNERRRSSRRSRSFWISARCFLISST